MAIPVPDLPETADDRPPTTEITLFRLGSFKHPRHGSWRITAEVLAGFIKNFARPLPVDFDHSPEHGRGTLAAGWITGIRLAGRELIADVEWTPPGVAAIRSGTYRFISPTWSFDGRDQHGNSIGPKLIGAACTNRPFFSDLPALTADDGIDEFDVSMFAEQEQSRLRRGSLELDLSTWNASAATANDDFGGRGELADLLIGQLERGEISHQEAAQAAEALCYYEEDVMTAGNSCARQSSPAVPASEQGKPETEENA
jgi:phage I-like protein